MKDLKIKNLLRPGECGGDKVTIGIGIKTQHHIGALRG